MFGAEALLVGLTAAFIVGLSKTGLPGGALIAVPMLATVFDGRLIAGGTLPILLAADAFAVAWYREHARWDVIRSFMPWLATGYAAGIAFFVLVGDASDVIARTVGVVVLTIVVLQIWRTRPRSAPLDAPSAPGTASTAAHGGVAGFTTFVANAAGPVINSYLLRLGLPKGELIGTSAWMYFAINLSKIPFYLALGAWTAGGPFFTAESLAFNLAVVPGVFAGAFAGRWLFHRLRQDVFVWIVLALSAVGALRLVV